MDCEAAGQRLSAWIDGELPPEEAAALESHVGGCEACRTTAEVLRGQDADLALALRPGREAAARVAAAVKRELVQGELGQIDLAQGSAPPARNVPAPAAARERGVRYAASLALAAAAGFVLAAVVFRPWQRTEGPPPMATDGIDDGIVIEPAATLVAATGEVEVLSPGSADWTKKTYLEFLVCPSDGMVRTAAATRCEFKTADGSVVRLNGDTQVRFASSGVVEVQRGQIACSSPENGALTVVTPEKGTEEPRAATTMTCQWPGALVANVAPDGGVQVTSVAGTVALQTAAATEPLEKGESARLVAGKIVEMHSTDPLLAAGWTSALLMRKGHDDAELRERVDQLLARVGQSKLALLYEQEIRALGEYAYLPLLKYVDSGAGRENAAQRRRGMAILADLAPAWGIGDLVRLLADDDGEIRYQAARALDRLTGQDQGRAPSEWRADLEACGPTIEAWRDWWRREGSRFPGRPGR